MDMGEAFKTSIHIEPGADDSFIVRVGERDDGRDPGTTFGFSNVTDLMRWLGKHEQAFQADRTQPLQNKPDGIIEVPAGSWLGAARS